MRDAHLARGKPLRERLDPALHPPLRIDPRGHAGVRAAQQRAARLDRAQGRIREVLLGARRLAKPGVVRDIHEQVGAIPRERAGERPERILKANERAELHAAARAA